MRKLVLWLAPLLMVAVIGAAFAWDCVRMLAAAQRRLTLADQEVALHEERLVALAAAPPGESPELSQAVADYRQSLSKATAARRAQFELLATAATAAGQKLQATPGSPAQRWLDDTAGAINRRTIAERRYREELADFQERRDSFRGRLAQRFAPGAGRLPDAP